MRDDPADDGGQEFDTGPEPGAGDEGLETLPGEDDGTPPEGAVEPAPEPWREAIGEAMAGMTAEMRQTLETHGRRTDSRFDEMSRRFQQPQPTPKPQEAPQHPWDEDPLNLVEDGGDPRLARYFKAQRAQSQAMMDHVKELENRISESKRTSDQRRQNDETAAHYGSQLQNALKAHGLTQDAERLDRIVNPLVMGLALLAPQNDPRGADVNGTVKHLEEYVQVRIKRAQDEQIKAGTLQASTPRSPPTGQGTRPVIQRGDVKTMADADREFDALLARHPDVDGPPEE